jgi:hypothetical protein
MYPTKGFTVDYYILDTNMGDVKSPDEDTHHNPCNRWHNKASNCQPFGPQNPDHCVEWFKELWDNQAIWLEAKLKESEADWQIIVTHYPPEGWVAYRKMFVDLKRIAQDYGVDLFVTGHRHVQTLYENGLAAWCDTAEIPYVVSGGGGGITSDFIPADAGDCHWTSKKKSFMCDKKYDVDKVKTTGAPSNEDDDDDHPNDDDAEYEMEKEGFKKLTEESIKNCDDPSILDWDPRWQSPECDKLLQPLDGQDMYGFMDMTISKSEIKIEGYNHAGTQRGTMRVRPRQWSDWAIRHSKTAKFSTS